MTRSLTFLAVLFATMPAFADPPRLVSAERHLDLNDFAVHVTPGSATYVDFRSGIGGNLDPNGFRVGTTLVKVALPGGLLACTIDTAAQVTQRGRVADDSPVERIVVVWSDRTAPVRCQFNGTALLGTLRVGRTAYTITRKE